MIEKNIPAEVRFGDDERERWSGVKNRVELAKDYYDQGFNCAQAVLCAYADRLGLDEKTAFRMMEGFGGGFGGMQEMCGALSAAFAVVGYHASDGAMENGRTKLQTYRLIRQTAELFQEECGGVTCLQILHGKAPKPKNCGPVIEAAAYAVEEMLVRIEQDRTVSKGEGLT